MDSEVPFPCPSCGRTTLEIVSDSIITNQTVASKKNQEEDFDIETREEIYKGIFTCINKKCEEKIYNIGKIYYELEGFDYVEFDGDSAPSRFEPVWFMIPEYITPFIKYFEIPNKTPNEIVNVINEAFKLTPTSYSAAANKIRVAVEVLCSTFGIESRDEKDYFISLNSRLKNIKKENDLFQYKNKLLAIKWLGNAGSHEEDDVDIESLFHSFEIIRNVLDGLYNKNDRVDRIVELVNENKGVIAPRERRSI